jgi:hypothetical protein
MRKDRLFILNIAKDLPSSPYRAKKEKKAGPNVQDDKNNDER